MLIDFLIIFHNLHLCFFPIKLITTLRMSFQMSNTKHSKSTQSQALQKISSFVSRFHAMLLPKANDQGVFRDLSQQQQYLLTALDSENPLHSILAGCLAIDSCLSNISQSQQNLTNNILRALTTLCSTWQKAQNDLIQSIQKKTLTIQKIQQMFRQAQQNTKKLMNFCYDLPFGQQNDEIKKQQKIMSQQDITFKLGSMKLFQDNDELNYGIKSNTNTKNSNSSGMKQLQKQNSKLQEQLSYAQKKIVHLELKISKLSDNAIVSKESQLEGKQKYHQRKYSQTGKGERFIQQMPSSFSKFATPSSSNTIQQKQTQMMRDQISFLEEQINKLKEQFAKQRKQLLNQIKFLQEQLKIADANQDKELIQLLEELQDQIESLREERRHDQRIIQQIQHKLSGMSVSRISRFKKNSRIRESKAGLRSSNNLYHQRQVFQDVNLGRGHEFKKQRNRNRIYTTNDQIQRSSTSMPRTNSFKNYNRQGQKLKFNWKQRIKTPLENYGQKNQYFNEPQLRYARKTSRPLQNYWSPQIRSYQQQKLQQNYQSKYEQNKRMIKRNLYELPLVQSKHGRQSFVKDQERLGANQIKNRKIQQEFKRGIGQKQKRNKIQGLNQNPYQIASNKAIRWQQITNNGGNREQEPRLKTSRI